MKKCLIIAAVVAMFAMVFTACGKDEDSGGAASQPELTLVYDNAVNTPNATTARLEALIVTWTGADGYDYEVYFEQRDPNGIITPISTSVAVKGQTLYALKANTNTSGAAVSPGWETDNIDAAEKNLWSIAVSSQAGKQYYYGADMPTSSGTVTTALETVFGSATFGAAAGSGLRKQIEDALESKGAGRVPRSVYYRIGVAAANPGGYPLAEKRTVVYSEWF